MWIVFALLVRLLWAGTNAVDQLLARVHPERKTAAAITLQGLCYFPFALLTWFLSPPFSFHAQFLVYCAAAISGSFLGVLPYLGVLQREESYNVVPYLELTPVFFIILSYILKGEVLTGVQLAGAAIIIVSGFLFSWDFARGRFKLKILAQLAVSALFWAFYQYSIRQAGSYADVWSVLAGYYFGYSCVGLFLFLALKDARKIVRATLKASKGRSLCIALGTNTLEILALACLLLAFRYAPTGDHVAAFSGTQPLFSLALAVPLGLMFPAHFARVAIDRQTMTKLALVIVIGLGVYLLNAG